MVFTNEILFLVLIFVLNKINLTWDSTKLNFVTFSCTFELTWWGFCFIVTLTLYLIPQRHQPKACSRNIWAKQLQWKMKKNILEVPLGLHSMHTFLTRTMKSQQNEILLSDRTIFFPSSSNNDKSVSTQKC